MRILIDTNILIPLEDVAGVLDEAYSELVRICHENNHEIVIHPGSLEDLARDKNDERKRILISKTQKYKLLESPPVPAQNELLELGITEKNPNDKIDNLILYSIKRSAAHLLITEDRRLHRKAKLLGVEDNVHYIQQTLTFLQTSHRIKEIKMPNVSHVPLHNLKLEDHFFDSLRHNYTEFNQWFRTKSAEGRHAWCVNDKNGTTSALLIYKDENQILIHGRTPLLGRTLKMCTFKVAEEIRGRRIGELLLKKAFEHSIQNGYRYIYLTIRLGEHEHLKDMCEDFGFHKFGLCEHLRDEIYIKEIPSAPPQIDQENFEYYRKYHPFFGCEGQEKFILPIRPEFHKLLFPEIQPYIQPLLFGELPVAGNTIKKAYLSHGNVKNIKIGDIVLFYRSKDKKAITTIGIVERFERSNDPDEISKMVSKRTVYSREEIEKLSKKETKVILFRQISHFPSPISTAWMHRNNIIRGSVQTIRKISDDGFKRLLAYGGRSNCGSERKDEVDK